MKSAIGETDVPDALPEFISQRRRWLNGSFFAATYAIAHSGQILESGHSIGRKFVLLVQTVYNVMNLIASWFAIVSAIIASGSNIVVYTYAIIAQGNFYLLFVILTSSLENPSIGAPGVRYVNAVIQVTFLSVSHNPYTANTSSISTQWQVP